MTTLRAAVQEFVADYENGDLGDLKHYARALRAALAQPDMHPQCAQGCEFLAMEQRRNERETTLKERGFE